MLRIAIRDDDTNYFTKPEDLEAVYADFNGFPVSFAVIPAVTDVSTYGACRDTKGNATPRRLVENSSLVAYLRKKYVAGECDILMHGIGHTYKFIQGRRFAEMEYLQGAEEEIKQHLEELNTAFGKPIRIFVAPSNKISRKNIVAVSRNNLDFSGIIDISFNRSFSWQAVKNYLFRWGVRAVRNLPYPGVLNYGTHLELNACTLPTIKEKGEKMLAYCASHQLPLCINVHYWSLRDNKAERDFLRQFVFHAVELGFTPSTMDDILHSHRKRTQ